MRWLLSLLYVLVQSKLFFSVITKKKNQSNDASYKIERDFVEDESLIEVVKER